MAVIERTANTTIFALRLAHARERAGLTQTQLGLLAGLDPSVASPRINQYERGKHEPSQRTARRLAEVLGIPVAFLYTEDELLTQVLLHWGELKPKERALVAKQVADLVGTASEPKSKQKSADSIRSPNTKEAPNARRGRSK